MSNQLAGQSVPYIHSHSSKTFLFCVINLLLADGLPLVVMSQVQYIVVMVTIVHVARTLRC